MKSGNHTARAATAATVLGLLCAGFTAPAPSTPAESVTVSAIGHATALQRAADQCGGGEICFWRDRNYRGTPWRWTPASGYRNMPAYLHDHVYSFYSNATGCFIDWAPEERRRVTPGDYARAYDTNFGTRIDAVDTSC
ncbi:peptidase inhibitor family I36 protein [Streptosporangium sp. NPDC051023]|uniref:peptidase inhibitor family I36 protein n=1 Tax=Streptosporangium sp. NPDC051023 TaxID=3155410 RepID=UPI0034506C29